MIKLARIQNSRVMEHFEGSDTDITLAPTADQAAVVAMPDWAWELRTENIRKGVADWILIYNYDTGEFVKSRPFTESQLVELVKADLRLFRSDFLAATDWAVSVSDYTLAEPLLSELTQWRQQLRDITDPLQSVDPAALMQRSLNRALSLAEFYPPMPASVRQLIERSAHAALLTRYGL